MAEPQPDSGSRRLDALVAAAVASLVLVAVLVPALVPDAGHHPPEAVSAVRPSEDPACAEWSDGCRVCQRLAEGPACSLPGIACTKGAQTCLRKAEP